MCLNRIYRHWWWWGIRTFHHHSQVYRVPWNNHEQFAFEYHVFECVCVCLYIFDDLRFTSFKNRCFFHSQFTVCIYVLIWERDVNMCACVCVCFTTEFEHINRFANQWNTHEISGTRRLTFSSMSNRSNLIISEILCRNSLFMLQFMEVFRMHIANCTFWVLLCAFDSDTRKW